MPTIPLKHRKMCRHPKEPTNNDQKVNLRTPIKRKTSKRLIRNVLNVRKSNTKYWCNTFKISTLSRTRKTLRRHRDQCNSLQQPTKIGTEPEEGRTVFFKLQANEKWKKKALNIRAPPCRKIPPGTQKKKRKRFLVRSMVLFPRRRGGGDRGTN